MSVMGELDKGTNWAIDQGNKFSKLGLSAMKTVQRPVKWFKKERKATYDQNVAARRAAKDRRQARAAVRQQRRQGHSLRGG